MKKLNVIDKIALTLVLVGALNWGLIGFFKWDLVAAIFGDLSSVTRVIYVIVGIAALWMLVIALPKAMKE
jgi:uncharacterized membrane protein YuzA (DUF378 family)